MVVSHIIPTTQFFQLPMLSNIILKVPLKLESKQPPAYCCFLIQSHDVASVCLQNNHGLQVTSYGTVLSITNNQLYSIVMRRL